MTPVSRSSSMLVNQFAPRLSQKVVKTVAVALAALHMLSHLPVAKAGLLCFAWCAGSCSAATAGGFAPACVAACAAFCATNPV